jgi:hypothetical protein
MHIPKHSPMACGNCGHGSFSLGRSETGLVTMCQKCRSVSTIEVTQPQIKIGWAEGNDAGVLSDMKADTF